MASQTKQTRREQRDRRREEERRRRDESAKRSQLKRYVTMGVIAVLLAAGVVLGVSAFSRPAAQGEQVASQGADHVAAGQPHDAYSSNPPTSGPHWADWARWGVHENPVPDEMLVHNLEHGGIVVHYNCPEGCPEVVEALRGVVAQYRSKVILAPRPDPTVDCRITLTAWTWLDCFEEPDAERIHAFVRAHKDRGPELVPD